MISKINISALVKGHIETLHHHGKSQKKGTRVTSKADIALFFVMPILPAALFFFYHTSKMEDARGIIISAFSIFAALLFSFLVLCVDIIEKYKGTNKSTIKEVSKDLFYNISYEILVSVAIVLILAVNIIFDHCYKTFVDSIAIYFSTNFFLTLLMILKRMHILLEEKNNNE